MHRVTAAALIAAVMGLAACGGGGGKQASSTTPSPKQNSTGGAVTAEPTKGFVGPATTVDQQGTKTLGKSAPLSPKENRPTDAQQNGVAGTAACASTAADPSGSDGRALAPALLCLLDRERAAEGPSAPHS